MSTKKQLPSIEERDYYTLEEVSIKSGFKQSTLRSKRSRGEAPFFRTSTLVMLKKDYEEWMQKLKEESLAKIKAKQQEHENMKMYAAKFCNEKGYARNL